MGKEASFISHEDDGIPGGSLDVTRAMTVERLQELEALESSILDAVPQAILGLHNRRIIFANNAIRDTFGWDRDELVGRSVTCLYRSEEESEKIARNFYSSLKEQRTFDTEFPCRHKDGRDILCRMRAARIGDTLNERRIVITYEDITEKKHAREELERSHRQLRELSAHLHSVREKESARIAREIHDELGQSLTALQMDINWLGDQLACEIPPLAEKTRRMARLVDATIESVHRIITELRPIMLDDLGLCAAIEWQAGEFESRSGIECRVQMDDCPEDLLEKDLATTVFRIFQETLTNTARHSGANLVRVRLRQEHDMLCLDVADNGRGITRRQAQDPRSFGIMGIRERVGLWDGQVRISGRSGRGTTVSVRIPLHREGRHS